ncbi:MAG TPA: nitrous oxide reductase accessory protein NosL [Puia sp.]
MTLAVRGMIIISSLALFAVLFFPLWQIQLAAPQYPEGLVLLIFPNKLGGNVDIINGLNHYIGMKTLHSGDFIEFTILPYIIIFFSFLLLLTGILGKRKLLNISFLLFLIFGVVAMIDFWKWEYNYGHNLNPEAAIIVPGMAYQPPLIGFKQLLNFGAYSIPDIGGWIFVGVGIVLLLAVFMEWKSFRKNMLSPNPVYGIIIFLQILLISACNPKAEPLIMGRDNCAFCTMTLGDTRFGAEIITQKGKIYKFDDAHCALSFLESAKLNRSQVKDIYFTDFSNGHSLIKSDDALFLNSEKLHAPMGGHISSFSNRDSLNLVMQEYSGSVLRWDELYKP